MTCIRSAKFQCHPIGPSDHPCLGQFFQRMCSSDPSFLVAPASYPPQRGGNLVVIARFWLSRVQMRPLVSHGLVGLSSATVRSLAAFPLPPSSPFVQHIGPIRPADHQPWITSVDTIALCIVLALYLRFLSSTKRSFAANNTASVSSIFVRFRNTAFGRRVDGTPQLTSHSALAPLAHTPLLSRMVDGARFERIDAIRLLDWVVKLVRIRSSARVEQHNTLLKSDGDVPAIPQA